MKNFRFRVVGDGATFYPQVRKWYSWRWHFMDSYYIKYEGKSRGSFFNITTTRHEYVARFDTLGDALSFIEKVKFEAKFYEEKQELNKDTLERIQIKVKPV